MKQRSTSNARHNLRVVGSKRSHRPTEQEISLRAYEIFLARGAAHGHSVEDWLQAERELSQEQRDPARARAV